jgi:hypothetical protein
MSTPGANRRDFLKTASLLTAAAAAGTGCEISDRDTTTSRGTREVGFDRGLLDAVASAVLPASLGTAGILAATDRFVAWVDGYEPVAEEMHGYGYSDVRYLPADPAPAWRAQLAALEVLARKTQRRPFAELDLAQRRTVLEASLRPERGERLPSPLSARHVALALLAHWASRPEAWNRALNAQVSPQSCRPLEGAARKPLPLAPVTAEPGA